VSFALQVAGLRIRVDAEGVDLVLGPEHQAFRADCSGAPDLHLTFLDDGEAPWFPRGAQRFQAHNALEVYESEGGWVASWASGARLRTEARFSEDCAEARIRVSPWPSGCTLATVGQLYEIACVSRLARCGGGFLVHACALNLPGLGGVLLPGSSGRGKSTIAALHAETALGDERVALTRGPDGRTWIHGTPWRGTERRVSSASTPLRAILFLGPHQPPFGGRPIGRAEAFQRLAFHAFPPLWDPTGFDRVLDLALHATTEVPAGELCLPLDHELPERLRRAVESLC
jgi:hypothetical protein